MLTKLLERLNGHAGDPASLAEALGALGRERIAARTSLKELQERRRQALLDDAADSQLDKLEREIDRGQTRIEKLDMAEAPLREQLSAAQAAAAKRAEDEAVSKFLDLAERSATALEACDVAFVQQRLHWDKNQHLLRRVEPLGCALILGEGHGVAWAIQTRKRIAEVRAARERRDNPQLAPQPPANAQPQSAHDDRPRLAHERQRITDSQREVSVALPTGPTSQRAPQANDVGPLLEGHIRVIALRSGYTDHQGIQHHAGHIFQLRREYAEASVLAGALEICEESATTAPAVSSGAWKSLKGVSSLTAAVSVGPAGEIRK
jgi:hypothetical protein